MGNVVFSSSAEGYATTNGLKGMLEGGTPKPNTSRLAGQSYSELVQLHRHAEIEHCNSRISQVFHSKLQSQEIAKRLGKVVGEVHDNVPSHSRGHGFSAAQVLTDKVHFAIADGGCGLLRNAQTKDPTIYTEEQAIKWACVKGNTSAPEWNDMDQRGVDFDWEDQTRDDHHQGLGLWHLTQLVDITKGKLWISTGSTALLRQGGSWGTALKGFGRNVNFAIEIEVPLAFDAETLKNLGGPPELESILKELGL